MPIPPDVLLCSLVNAVIQLHHAKISNSIMGHSSIIITMDCTFQLSTSHAVKNTCSWWFFDQNRLGLKDMAVDSTSMAYPISVLPIFSIRVYLE